MATQCVMQVNTRHHRKGDVVSVSAAEMAAHPEYYRPKADVDAEREQVEREKSGEVSSSDWHRQMRAQMAAEHVVLQQMQADVRRKLAEADMKLADEGVKAAARHAEEQARAQREAEQAAKIAELERLLAEQKKTEGKILELRPQPEPAPEKAAEAPAAPADKPAPPHLRKRGE